MPPEAGEEAAAVRLQSQYRGKVARQATSERGARHPDPDHARQAHPSSARFSILEPAELRERVMSIEADLDAGLSERDARGESECPPLSPAAGSSELPRPQEWQDINLDLDEAKEKIKTKRASASVRDSVASALSAGNPSARASEAVRAAAPTAPGPMALSTVGTSMVDVELEAGSSDVSHRAVTVLASKTAKCAAAATLSAAAATAKTAAAAKEAAAAKTRGAVREVTVMKKAARVAAKAAVLAAKNPGQELPSADGGVSGSGDGVATSGVSPLGITIGEEHGEGDLPPMKWSSASPLSQQLERSLSSLSERFRSSSDQIAALPKSASRSVKFKLGELGASIKTMRVRKRSVLRSAGKQVLEMREGRGATAKEGIVLLKTGCVATKYSKRGIPRQARFKLSEDESKLLWSSQRPNAKRCSLEGIVHSCGSWREVVLADVLDMPIGQQSEVFKKHQHRAAQDKDKDKNGDPPHLSLSLVLMGKLPPRPDEMDDAAELEDLANMGTRVSLDLSFDDDEVFGLWVAAVRALLDEGQQRPAAYAAPFNPLHVSAGAALRLAAPPDASRCERLRDASLLSLDLYTKTRTFIILTVLWVIAVVVFGCMFFFLLIGAHGFEDQTDAFGNVTASATDRANDLGNISIQILTALFSYITLFTLPWRIANAAHLWCSRRSCEAGLDFYGRPAKGIWWHIPPQKRKCIVGLLVGNAFMQYATQACRFAWSSYAASQAFPGALFINLTFLSSILCGMGSGIAQGNAEGGVRKANPGMFPPTPLEIAWQTWKAELERVRTEMRADEEAERAAAMEEAERAAAMEEGGALPAAASSGAGIVPACASQREPDVATACQAPIDQRALKVASGSSSTKTSGKRQLTEEQKQAREAATERRKQAAAERRKQGYM
jgi:hypothetical protein